MTKDELLARVRAALPALEAQAAASETLRRPTDAAIATLEETGIFRMLVPKVRGGYELDVDAFLECALALGEADMSLAWVAAFLVEHNWLFCQYPESFQRELFDGRTHVLAPAAIHGESTVAEDGDGYRLSGRWRWASGAMHATWAMVGAVAPGDVAPGFFALPMEDVEIDDVWHVDGLCGTGSNDLVVRDAFVPRDRVLSLASIASGQGEGARLYDAPVYASPMVVVLMTAAGSPIVGQARSVVRRFRDKTVARTRMGGVRSERDKTTIQLRLALADAAVREAELVLRDVVADLMERRATATLADRARWALGITRAVHGARGAIQTILEASGGSAHFRDDPQQRALRDANVCVSHVAFDWDGRHELHGRLALGLEPQALLV
ncbi:MAG: hypothetical protein R3E88_14125 [Myxococcota bacterium]